MERPVGCRPVVTTSRPADCARGRNSAIVRSFPPTRTAATNQIARIEIVKAGDPDTKRLGYKLDRWIDIGGLKLATVYENIGLVGEVITFTSVSADAEPDETLYVPVVVP
jgi:hypothetical protein